MESNIWFTSDSHFRHTNILKYCNRKIFFNGTYISPNIDAMDAYIIAQWNKVVKPGDNVYHLGDFAFCSTEEAIKIRQQLNGNIYLIKGNHDKRLIKDKKFQEQFIWIKDYFVLKIPDEEMNVVQRVVLFHYPIESWDGIYHGSWHLHGHCHGNLPSTDKQARLDVGVDSHNYAPISYEKVKEIMTAKVMKKEEP